MQRTVKVPGVKFKIVAAADPERYAERLWLSTANGILYGKIPPSHVIKGVMQK